MKTEKHFIGFINSTTELIKTKSLNGQLKTDAYKFKESVKSLNKFNIKYTSLSFWFNELGTGNKKERDKQRKRIKRLVSVSGGEIQTERHLIGKYTANNKPRRFDFIVYPKG